MDDLIPLAKTFVEQMNKGDFKAATEPFDDAMRQAMPSDKLRETWQALLGQVGAFKQQTGTHTAKAPGYDIVFVTCQFTLASIDVRVVFDSHKKIGGLFFQNAVRKRGRLTNHEIAVEQRQCLRCDGRRFAARAVRFDHGLVEQL